MTDIRQIPSISRGRIIMPGDNDRAEYKGRGGSAFVSPDPHKHIKDLVLGDPLLLADLNDTKMAEIIDFLAEAGKRASGLRTTSTFRRASRWASRRAGWPSLSSAVFTTSCPTCWIPPA